MKTTGTWNCACVNITRPSATLDRCSILDWSRWHVTLFTSSSGFQKSPYSHVHTRNEAFSKVSTFETFFESPRFQRRFSVDDRRKRIKKALCGYMGPCGLSQATRLGLVTYFFVLTAFRSESSKPLHW